MAVKEGSQKITIGQMLNLYQHDSLHNGLPISQLKEAIISAFPSSKIAAVLRSSGGADHIYELYRVLRRCVAKGKRFRHPRFRISKSYFLRQEFVVPSIERMRNLRLNPITTREDALLLCEELKQEIRELNQENIALDKMNIVLEENALTIPRDSTKKYSTLVEKKDKLATEVGNLKQTNRNLREENRNLKDKIREIRKKKTDEINELRLKNSHLHKGIAEINKENRFNGMKNADLRREIFNYSVQTGLVRAPIAVPSVVLRPVVNVAPVRFLSPPYHQYLTPLPYQPAEFTSAALVQRKFQGFTTNRTDSSQNDEVGFAGAVQDVRLVAFPPPGKEFSTSEEPQVAENFQIGSYATGMGTSVFPATEISFTDDRMVPCPSYELNDFIPPADGLPNLELQQDEPDDPLNETIGQVEPEQKAVTKTFTDTETDIDGLLMSCDTVEENGDDSLSSEYLSYQPDGYPCTPDSYLQCDKAMPESDGEETDSACEDDADWPLGETDRRLLKTVSEALSLNWGVNLSALL